MNMSAQHIHLIDGKQVAYDIDKCPICHPELTVTAPPTKDVLPRCYRKHDTIVCQVSRGLMSTTTYWAKGNAILHSVRKIQRDAQDKVLVGADNKPIWQQLTMRLSIAIAKIYRDELTKLIADVESQQTTSTVPQRA